MLEVSLTWPDVSVDVAGDVQLLANPTGRRGNSKMCAFAAAVL